MATRVKLRQRVISGERHSLYLDFYPPIPHPETGKPTRREFLGLYLLDKPKNPLEKQENKETLQLAETIRAKRQIEIQKGDFGFLNAKVKEDADFVQFFKQVLETKTGGNKRSWQVALTYLEAFTGGKLPISELNANFCNEFREYLITAKSRRGLQNSQIAQNSARIYFSKFKTALNQAFKKGLLEVDLSARVDGIAGVETQREFLTIEELRILTATPCSKPLLKNAAIFSALTGLRFSDIEKLTWSEVQSSEGEYFLHYRQKKTKNVEVLPIPWAAYNLLGDRKEPTARVFEGLTYSGSLNLILKRWVLKAGITKDITFHCFRHTFATLQLSNGTDIYTVSALLGHKNLSTTQIYAKVMDNAKRKAADAIKL